MKGWRSREVLPSGKRPIVFNPRKAYIDQPVEVPCGQCIGCRLERSRQWAVRCVHESMMNEKNCFITLTYNDENMPADKSLRPKDFVNFMKRLRKMYGPGIKYYHAGEYGSTCDVCGLSKIFHKDVRGHSYVDGLGRPHHHACLFGIDFEDKAFFQEKAGNRLYTSEILFKLWHYKGHCIIGDVTFDSAAYVARYITKKIFGKKAESHYRGKYKEYTTMSKGIGKSWFEKYGKSVFRDDNVVINKKRVKPPKYYDLLMEEENPRHVAKIKNKRLQEAEKSEDFGNSKRLRVKEKVKRASIKNLKRGYEDEI